MVGADINTQNSFVDPMLGNGTNPSEIYAGDFQFTLLNQTQFDTRPQTIITDEVQRSLDRFRAQNPKCEPLPPELLQNPQLLSLLPKLTSVCYLPDLESIPGNEQGGIVIKLNETSTTPEELDVAITIIANSFGMTIDEFTGYCSKMEGEILGKVCVIEGEKFITLPVQGGNVLMTGTAFHDLLASKFWPPTTLSLDQFMQMLSEANVEAYTDSSVAEQAIKALKESTKLEVMASATITPTSMPNLTMTPSTTPGIETLTPTPPLAATSNPNGFGTPVSQTDIELTKSPNELSPFAKGALKAGGYILFIAVVGLAAALVIRRP